MQIWLQRLCMQILICRLKERKRQNTVLFSQVRRSAAGHGYVDAVISPADTRKYIIGAFEMLFTKERIVRQRNMEQFSEVKQIEEEISLLMWYACCCIYPGRM